MQDQRASGLGHLWSHLLRYSHPQLHILQLRRDQLPVLLVLFLPPLLRHLLQCLCLGDRPQLVQQILLETADLLLRGRQHHELVRPKAGNVNYQQPLRLDQHLPRHARFHQGHIRRHCLLPHQNHRLGQRHLELPPGHLRRCRPCPHLLGQPQSGHPGHEQVHQQWDSRHPSQLHQ